MKVSDIIKLRCSIYNEFKHWFSFNRKYKCLYCDWSPNDDELNQLLHFVEPFGFNVLFVFPCSVFIYAKK